MITAQEALQLLKDGNRRFLKDQRDPEAFLTQHRRKELAKTQEPHTILLGCSDSRVPGEIVFDQGLGDLFVIRVAGNVIAPSLVGSVEFAAAKFGTPLVVVMGHSSCGAILATIEELKRPTANQSPNLRDIVERVRPSVQGLMELGIDGDALVRKAVRANIRNSVGHLMHGSRLLEALIAEGKLTVVGAEYDLATGEVTFLDS